MGSFMNDLIVLGGSAICDVPYDSREVSKEKRDVVGELKKSIFTVTSFMDDPYGHPTQVVSRLQFSFASWFGLVIFCQKILIRV
jgi:hypothetical protein